jgi:tetratricopeptide (TPR) repeat protein
VVESATMICKALGFLPLALVHAGKAIMLGLCPWSGYLPFYERQIKRIRRERQHQRDRSLSRSKRRHQEDDDSMNVFSSYEILYQSLLSSEEQRFRDAVELLHLFSYLHFQNIRLDILVNAAINPMREAKEREKEAREDEELQKKLQKLKRETWSQWFRGFALYVASYLDTPPPLPTALKNTDSLSQSDFEDEVRDRLGIAALVLVSRSLIMTQDRVEGRYCMHPLVHKWVRERPEMSTSHQALWCHITTATLARNILFPPLGDTDKERGARRELLPHIIHVKSCQSLITEKLKENRTFRKSIWPVLDSGFGRHQALEAARFSRVYSEAGLFNEALQLQTRTRMFATQTLGEEHPLTIKITLFVVSTLWELSRTDEGTKLQRRVYDICVKSLGEDHPLTLRVTDLLGSSLCWKGRWSEALALHERGVEGMTRIYGKDHENTLKAINNLARVFLRYMEWEKANEFHQRAWEGMKNRLGDSHVDTLICLEDLAMCRLRLGEQYLLDCHNKMMFVLEKRKEMLGKEHPYTLLAICNLGRVKSAMGHHSEAATIMKEAAAIAERNLGEDHFGVLAGKTHYAQVLVHLGRFSEAEEIFFAVVDKPQYRKATDEDGEHPDRLVALWYLVGCLEKQGKLQGALEICQGLVESLQEIGGNSLGLNHKFAAMVEEEIVKIKEKMTDIKQAAEEVSIMPGEL